LVSVVVHHSFNIGTANIDQALKSLQRKMQREAVVRETKIKRYHEKPSAKRKRRIEESNRRRRKINRKTRSDVSYRGFVLFNFAEQGAVNRNENEEGGEVGARDVGHSG
jgi:small subunit ribosomal protein S21